MSTKITLTPEAIDRLLKSDPETALEIKQSIAAEFAKRYLKCILDEDLKIQIKKIASDSVAAFKEEYIVQNNGRYVLTSIHREQMKKHMEEYMKEDLQKLCDKIYHEAIQKINEKFTETMRQLDTVENTIIENFANMAAERAYKKLKNFMANNL